MFPYGQFFAHRPQPMHQSSIITSSELRRRIAPTGQPTMHSGSRHWRHEVATRKFSKRRPSRTSRVTPSCESAQARHAGVAARAFFQVQHQQALRFHQSLREKTLQRHAANHAQPLRFASWRSRQRVRGPRGLRDTFPPCAKILRGNADHLDVVERRAGRRARSSAEQADFAEIIAARQIRQHQFAAGISFRNFHESEADQIKTVRGITLFADHLARARSA